MEKKVNVRQPGKFPSQILKTICKISQLEEITIPYSNANLERVNRILDFHSSYFQNIISFTHNNFEITILMETLAPGSSRSLDRALSDSDMEKLFVQFIALFETAKSRGFDFIDFSRFHINPDCSARFPLDLSKKIEPDLNKILPLFQNHDRFKHLHQRNYKDIFTDCRVRHKFNENRSYLYRFSDFTTNILNSYPVIRSGSNTNIKIKIQTGSIVQENIIKINLSRNCAAEDVFLISIDYDTYNLPAFISEILSGNREQNPADFAALVNEFKLFLRKSSYTSLLLLIDHLKTKEESECIKYLLEYSGMTDILLIVFGENEFIDFDLELKERPRNLLEKVLRFYNIEELADLNEQETYLLKVFKSIPVPLSKDALDRVFSADECYLVECLVKKKYLKVLSGNIYINVDLPGLNITVTQKEEKEILTLFLDKFDSLNVLIKYFINTGKREELKKNLKKYLQNRYKFEDAHVSIRRIFFDNLGFLRQEVELVRLFADIFLKENDLISARELFDCCRENDPVFLDLKLAHIFKLERNYLKMERILKNIEKKIPENLKDEFFYLKFINSVKQLASEQAEKYFKKIKSEPFRNLANIILSDHYIYRKELGKAEQLLEKTIAYLSKKRYTRDELDARNQLAKVFREKEEYDRAETLYKSIFIKSETNNYKLLSAHIAVDIGNLYLATDDPNQAEAWYKKALNIYRLQKNNNGEILAESNLVEISKIKGDWQEAENHLRSILNYDKEENKLDSLAIDYYNIAHLEYLRHNYSKALEVLNTAVSLFEKKDNLTGKIESGFLKLKIALSKEKGETGTESLEKYKDILISDQAVVFAIMQMPEKEGRNVTIARLIEKMGEIESKFLRCEILTLVIKRYRNQELLALLRGLSMELSSETRNYYYYEYYYVYFNYFFTEAEMDDEKREIFYDIYYFFLRNKRKISPAIYKIKKYLDEKESTYDLFKSAELVGGYNQWKIPEDIFKSLLFEINKIIRIDLVKLIIYEKETQLFNFSNPNKYNKLTDEIISSAISLAENLNLSFEDIRSLVKNEEKVFYFFKNTKVLLWKISDSLFAILLLAFAEDNYKDYDFFQRNRDFLKKFATLIQRYYEVDYKLHGKLDFIIGESLAMEALKKNILAIGNVDFPVLISGESGSGKELIAKGVHIVSRRADKPFIPVNSAAIPENLLEAELFGYRKGAFTGANENRTGLIEAAHQGSLFLDEIADLPMILQAKLLRVLQEKEIRRLGENTTKKVDFRLISATNKDLKTMAKANRFREDLYYRLEVLQIPVPPLRDRIEDIPLLAEHFLKENNFSINDQFEFQSIVEYLKSRDWPGNVRELESTIKRLITYYPDFEIGDSVTTKTDFSLKAAKDNLEKSLVIKTLRENNWNKIKTSRVLKISRMYLFNLIKKYNITRK
ncbi:MAG: sigma 54-interacting transcriptional regulator [Candidatus Aminicenantes bacterium]|nr:sigma 54-interacting transcriptional regulator [Candidatus Aminicenantes bacterium]